MATPAVRPEHAVLARDAGVWDAEVTVFPPAGDPIHARGVAENRMIGGGLWLVMDFRADSGFEGHGIYGYDPAARAYVGTWVDSMRTFLALSRGSWDEAARTMTLVTELPAGEGTLRLRETTTAPADDQRVWRMFVPDGEGGEREAMTVVYRRR